MPLTRQPHYSLNLETRSLNFLIVTFDFPPEVGGIETRVKNYIQNLIKMKCHVEVVALTLTDNTVFVENYLGATVYRCPSSPRFVFKVFSSVIKAIGRYPLKVIYLLTGANTLIGLLFLVYGKVKRLKTGAFLYGKDILTSKNSPLGFLTLHLALMFADKIGVNSRATSQLLPRQTLHKVHVLYPGVNIQAIRRYRLRQLEGEKEKKILFVGRLIKRKGVDDLLQAFKLVLERVPEARLIIVGDGPERTALHHLANALGIHHNVEFTGTLTGKRLYTKYQECEVFAMPSKKIDEDVEGFGIVFIEAGFFKKPSVGTWSGGIPEAVLDKQTGILVPEGDVIALKNAIELLLTNRDLAKELGINAYNRVISEFTWEKATSRLLEMF